MNRRSLPSVPEANQAWAFTQAASRFAFLPALVLLSATPFMVSAQSFGGQSGNAIGGAGYGGSAIGGNAISGNAGGGGRTGNAIGGSAVGGAGYGGSAMTGNAGAGGTTGSATGGAGYGGSAIGGTAISGNAAGTQIASNTPINPGNPGNPGTNPSGPGTNPGGPGNPGNPGLNNPNGNPIFQFPGAFISQGDQVMEQRCANPNDIADVNSSPDALARRDGNGSREVCTYYISQNPRAQRLTSNIDANVNMIDVPLTTQSQ